LASKDEKIVLSDNHNNAFKEKLPSQRMSIFDYIPDFMQKNLFESSLKDPETFSLLRKILYGLAGNDPERVHEMTLEIINRCESVLGNFSPDCDFRSLHVNVGGQKVMPFGTSAGLDKNFKVTKSLSNIFGFLEGGTVVLNKREGNKRPRVYADDKNQNGYNAQGFPSEGLEVVKGNLRTYRKSGGAKPVLVSYCGIPTTADASEIDVANRESETLLAELSPFCNAAVWNPYSPNTDALKFLRTKIIFRENAVLAKRILGDKPLLLKMGPYDDETAKRKEWLDLVGGFLEGGGDGIVAVNTYMVPKDKIPSPEWGYPSGGISGRFLQEYRQRAIKDFRHNFGKEYFLIATGGIDSADEAWKSFEAGANVVAGYTPYIFSGFSLIPQMASGVEKKLNGKGFKTLKDFQRSIGLA